MAARLEKTTVAGLYRRPQGTYTFAVRVNGRQTWRSYRTFDEARRAKQAASTDRDRGEFTAQSKITLHEYLADWLPPYRGNGRTGFRDETRYEYGLIIAKHYGWFPKTLKLTALDAAMVDKFVNHLAKQPGRRNATLSDATVRNILSPLRAAMASARREGKRRDNPVDGAVLPHTARVEEDHARAQPFENGTMERVIAHVHSRYRLMFELLGVTGLRRSELLALEGRHAALDSDQPKVLVRQRVRRQKGVGLVIGPVKSRYSRRDVPIPRDIADRLRALNVADDQLVFCTSEGTAHDANNLTNRVLSPALSKAGVIDCGWHTFRHTVASRLFAEPSLSR